MTTSPRRRLALLAALGLAGLAGGLVLAQSKPDAGEPPDPAASLTPTERRCFNDCLVGGPSYSYKPGQTDMDEVTAKMKRVREACVSRCRGK